MAITLFDLAGADPDLRFSPYCWRTTLAIAHKDLALETVPWRFTEGARLAPFGASTVPVILDGSRAIADSWVIAGYLENRYPDRPSLFEGPGGLAHACFINAWADAVVVPAVARMIVYDVWLALAPQDQGYFRSSREARFGATLEQVVADRDRRLDGFRQLLAPLRRVLRMQPWLGGPAPSYADYIAFGPFQWARCVSRFELLAADDPVAAWRTRVMDLFGGLAGRAATV